MNFLKTPFLSQKWAVAQTPKAVQWSQGRNFGANDKAIQIRMKSVRSVQKITKAMKMVAASKLKHDQRRLDNGLPFAEATMNFFKQVPIATPNGPTPLSLIALSSDKGLCGGVNAYVAKTSRAVIAEEEAKNNKIFFYGVGDKIRAAMIRLFGDRFVRMSNDVSKNGWNFTLACLVTERILADKPDRVKIIYNKFKSAIQYDTLQLDVMTEKGSLGNPLKELDTYEFEPERQEILQDLLEWNLSSSLFATYLDNSTSEQSARMSAMDNASKNAGELLSNLTLKYNKARQAKITMELIEIISGANAL